MIRGSSWVGHLLPCRGGTCETSSRIGKVLGLFLERWASYVKSEGLVTYAEPISSEEFIQMSLCHVSESHIFITPILTNQSGHGWDSDLSGALTGCSFLITHVNCDPPLLVRGSQFLTLSLQGVCTKQQYPVSSGVIVCTVSPYWPNPELLDLQWHSPPLGRCLRSPAGKESAVVLCQGLSLPHLSACCAWVPHSNVLTCFPGPLKVPLVWNWVLQEAGAKTRLHTWDLFGENVFKGKWGWSQGKWWVKPWNHDAAFWPYKGERKCLCRKTLRPQCVLRKFRSGPWRILRQSRWTEESHLS